MIYHVIAVETLEMKILTATDILDMGYDDEDRVVIVGYNQESYFLIASKDLIDEQPKAALHGGGA
ncbi:hypothetical protein [Paenibacillus piri]|uniref:Uncharacterized protein n=1 Tax=Paenibacillus piri TaxID=2547395 RepID=A0A4R5KCA8_9BACL|nr:hypothetical protein [Paenibacillus piri]TDF92766.1 hypothetical protein E1757_29030 [Paenibacillus piri]